MRNKWLVAMKRRGKQTFIIQHQENVSRMQCMHYKWKVFRATENGLQDAINKTDNLAGERVHVRE